MSDLALEFYSYDQSDIVKDKIRRKLSKVLQGPPAVWVRVKSENNKENITARVRTDDGYVLLAKEKADDLEKGGNKVLEKLEKQLKKKKSRRKKHEDWFSMNNPNKASVYIEKLSDYL